MEIQPSNVSHLLNGRNKPSLDFLTKLKEIFPEYSFDWIIMGKKPITINEPTPVTFEDNKMRFEEVDDDRINEFDDIDEHFDNEFNKNVIKSIDNQVVEDANVKIEKIILVYSDKTFDIISAK